MTTWRPAQEPNLFADLDRSRTQILTPALERSLLEELADCKSKLARALEDLRGSDVHRAGDDPQALARYIAETCARGGPGQACLGAVYWRYREIRTRLALANTNLVAHFAKRFRGRGIPCADLLQEGFCGLLEAIDRFDLAHRTKLATYATWWIRQAMQRAVAAGAYPVRLTPRHLRQVAEDQDRRVRKGPDPDRKSNAESGSGSQLIPFIHAAIRPAVSLDVVRVEDTGGNLLQTISERESDLSSHDQTDEAVGRLMEVLRPREQQVLSLRFGLGGRGRMSLSQVGRVLAVSKERVRQIEDQALHKLKARAEEQNLSEKLAWGT
jgi:RNA polymerase primary sigma factor